MVESPGSKSKVVPLSPFLIRKNKESCFTSCIWNITTHPGPNINPRLSPSLPLSEENSHVRFSLPALASKLCSMSSSRDLEGFMFYRVYLLLQLTLTLLSLGAFLVGDRHWLHVSLLLLSGSYSLLAHVERAWCKCSFCPWCGHWLHKQCPAPPTRGEPWKELAVFIQHSSSRLVGMFKRWRQI